MKQHYKLVCALWSALWLLMGTNSACAQTDSVQISLNTLALRTMMHHETIRSRALETQKVKIDLSKVKMSYLPKIQAEVSYTYMNDELAFPSDLIDLLNGAQGLLIKEKLAQNTNGQINFQTAPEIAILPDGTTLKQVIASQSVEIPPIQEQGFLKASVNAHMMMFSGLKVSRTTQAIKHQMNALTHLSEADKQKVLLDLIDTYDKLAIARESGQTLQQTEMLLKEQMRFAEKAMANGLTTSLSKQKIALALEQMKVKQIELEMAQTLTAMQLSDLTGIPADSIRRMHIRLTPWPLQNRDYTAENRPEIKAIDEAIEATQWKQKAEMSEYIPKVIGFGKYEFYKENLTILDPQWYVGVGLRWTLFDGLAARNQSRQIAIDKQILENKRDHSLTQAQLKLEKDKLEQIKHIQLLETALLQVKLAKEVLHLSKRQFELGLITLNEHLASVQEYEKSCLNQIQTIAAQRHAAMEYLMSSGLLQIENIPIQ